ncbi:MAG: ABC transporter ATP-binding protein [Oscillospiraceae bacterium]
MLELVNISKKFRYHGKLINALSDVSLKIDNAEMIAVMGESGAGKSTLLHIIGGLLSPSTGKYYYDDKLIDNIERNLSKFRNNNIGFVFQNLALILHKNIFYNISLPLLYKGKTKKEIEEAVHRIALDFGIEDKLYMYPNVLSGGECQRAAVARAIISNPSIILADEPTSSLDTKNKKFVMDKLVALKNNGKTVIIATHDKEIACLCDRVIYLGKGLIEDAY